MAEFRKLGEETLFSGSLIQVARGTYRAPDGERFTREVVHHPGAVVVVPLVDQDTALLVRQYRSSVGELLLECPAGKRDVEGEPTEVTASRELVEEVGQRAGRLELLARFYTTPGFCDELAWLYLAEDLEAVPHDRQGVEEQAMTVEAVSLSDLDRLVHSGEVVDAKTIVGLSLARERVRGRRDVD